MRVAARTSRAPALATAALLLAAWPPRAAPAQEPGAGDQAQEAPRIALRLGLLGVGRDGSRPLGERRLVVDVPNPVRWAPAVSLRGARGAVACSASVRVGTGQLADGRFGLPVQAEARCGEIAWRRTLDAALYPGTSTVLELTPGDGENESLVFSLTVDTATGEPLTVEPRPVDIEMVVSLAVGKEERILQRPRLRAMAGEPATFEFSMAVPGPTGDDADTVRFRLIATPSQPAPEGLSVVLEVEATYPGVEGPILLRRRHALALRHGESQRLDLPSPGEGQPAVRVALRASWDRGSSADGPL